MDLFIMRHTDAVDGDGNDFARVLSDRGRRQAARMGDWLKGLKAGPLTVMASPYPRAHETGVIVAKHLADGSTVQPDERLRPGMASDIGAGIIHELGLRCQGVLLVGHSPDLDRLVAHLIGAKDGGVEMRKGAIAHLQTVRAGFGGSTLRWLIDPKL